MNAEPFTIAIPEAKLADLRGRRERINWAPDFANDGWAYDAALALAIARPAPSRRASQTLKGARAAVAPGKELGTGEKRMSTEIIRFTPEFMAWYLENVEGAFEDLKDAMNEPRWERFWGSRSHYDVGVVNIIDNTRVIWALEGEGFIISQNQIWAVNDDTHQAYLLVQKWDDQAAHEINGVLERMESTNPPAERNSWIEWAWKEIMDLSRRAFVSEIAREALQHILMLWENFVGIS